MALHLLRSPQGNASELKQFYVIFDDQANSRGERRWAVSEPNSVILVTCNLDGSIVGFLSGGAKRTGRLGYEREFYEIYLLQFAQPQGLGTLLVQHFVRELRATFEGMRCPRPVGSCPQKGLCSPGGNRGPILLRST